MSFLFISHFISDFILQSREMGQKKSKDPVFLLAHVMIIFLVMTLAGSFVFDSFNTAVVFSFWNSLLHLVIDAISWNAYGYYVMGKKFGFDNLHAPNFRYKEKALEVSANYEFWKDEKFFWTIGADQVAHMIVLYELYEIFKTPVLPN